MKSNNLNDILRILKGKPPICHSVYLLNIV